MTFQLDAFQGGAAFQALYEAPWTWPSSFDGGDMRPTYVTRNATGATSPIPVDLHRNPFNIGLFLIITGTANATVQYTGDNVQAPGYDPALGTWWSHADLTAKTANSNGTLIAPVTAVRLLVNSYTDGNVTLQLLQAGS